MKLAPWTCIALSCCAWAANVPQEAVVRFSTVCFNCHEGECSGRLSFQGGTQAARNHVRRYLGPVPERDVETYFALLKYTKERCAHYPISHKPPANGRWQGADLAAWHNPVEGGYFVPLGQLAAGQYRLSLAFAGQAQGRARVTDAHFEIAAEESLCGDTPPELRFASAGGEHYFHLQGAGELQALELARLPALSRNDPAYPEYLRKSRRISYP